MAVPDFLNHGFRYLTTAGVVDVNTIIADLMSELVTNGTWTDLGGTGVGPFKSPVEADGSYFKITLARTSATRLNWLVNDQWGLLVNNQTSNNQDIDAGGSLVRYYTGPDYVIVETARATPEVMMAARLNQWPEDVSKMRPSFISSTGPRNNAGSLTANACLTIFALPLYATAYATANQIIKCGVYASAESHLVTLSGAYMFMPAEVVPTGYHCLIGRIPNVLIVDTNIVIGTELVVPIDVGLTGTFKVLGFTAADYRRLAARIA